MAIEVTFGTGKRVNAQLGAFRIETDQPVASGGEDAAPSPFGLFLASLATCAGYFVLAYLQARNLPSEGVRLTQDVVRDAGSGAITGVTIQIHLPATIDPRHHGPIVRSAESCSVKKLIQTGPQIDVEVVPA